MNPLKLVFLVVLTVLTFLAPIWYFFVQVQEISRKLSFLHLNTDFGLLDKYGRPYAYGKITPVYTRIGRGENAELAFGVFIRVISLNVSFHFPLVPNQSELWCSRYDQNTTCTSRCKTFWKLVPVSIDGWNPSQVRGGQLSGYLQIK